MKSKPQKVALPIPLGITITTPRKITVTEITKRERSALTKVAKKNSAATEEVAVEATEETTTESTIRMRRASKLLSKMKLIIITTIQRDLTAGDPAAAEAAREVARVETTTLTEVVVVAKEVRVAPGLPKSTKTPERSERPNPSSPLVKIPYLIAKPI